jgi:hypothetical protein
VDNHKETSCRSLYHHVFSGLLYFYAANKALMRGRLHDSPALSSQTFDLQTPRAVAGTGTVRGLPARPMSQALMAETTPANIV